MATLRWNPLASRWVVLSAERARRPEVRGEARDRPCPFCPGSEAETTETITTYGEGPSGWRVRVFTNRYPAFDETERDVGAGSRGRERPARGRHEVLVLSPDHRADPADLDDDQFGYVLRAIADRMAAHAREGFSHTELFVNVGRAAGASVAHPHGQLISTDIVPAVTEQEEAELRGPQCPLCAAVAEERDEGERLVAHEDSVLLICPYWSEWPYEMLVLPSSHVAGPHSDRASLRGVGRALRLGLRKLRDVGVSDYNIVLHAGPHRPPTPDAFHWHVHVYPRAHRRAGFELASGMVINTLPPEEAASRLRAYADHPGQLPAGGG